MKLLNFILDLFFPTVCVGCSRFGRIICSNCEQSIEQKELICPFCKRPSVGGATHPVCRRARGLDGLWSLGSYTGVLRSAIKSLKYRFAASNSDILIDILIKYWLKHRPYLLDLIKQNPESWVIVPIPLYWQRQNWRGFNQAAVLSEILAKKIGIKQNNLLQRIRHTTPQVGLPAHKRRRNIKDAFEITDVSTIKTTPNIILFDDVWTTGATMSEATKVLKGSGAKQVWALTLAR